MARPKSPPSTRINLALPESDRVKLDLHLFSELEGRVPYSEYSKFFVQRIREYFAWETLDLTPFGYPPGFFVKGPKEMIQTLKERLK